jgi:hypothetical protein
VIGFIGPEELQASVQELCKTFSAHFTVDELTIFTSSSRFTVEVRSSEPLGSRARKKESDRKTAREANPCGWDRMSPHSKTWSTYTLRTLTSPLESPPKKPLWVEICCFSDDAYLWEARSRNADKYMPDLPAPEGQRHLLDEARECGFQA